jgi:hypothetical protein
MQKKMAAETAFSAVNRNQGKYASATKFQNTIKETVMMDN